MQPQNFHPSRQRVRQARNQQHVGRPGEQKPARRPAAVDRYLERREEPRRALDLVEDRALRQIGHEADRILRGRREWRGLVEVEVCVARTLTDLPRQRGLAALSRPMNQHDRRIGQRLGEALLGVPGVEFRFGHERPIVTLDLG